MTLSYFSSGFGHVVDLVICLVEWIGWISLIVISLVINYLLCEGHNPQMVFIKKATEIGMVLGSFGLFGTSLIIVMLLFSNLSTKRIIVRNELYAK